MIGYMKICRNKVGFHSRQKPCSTCHANVLPLNSAVLNTSNTLLCNTYLLQAATLPHICCYESSQDNPTIATTYNMLYRYQQHVLSPNCKSDLIQTLSLYIGSKQLYTNDTSDRPLFHINCNHAEC